MTRDGQDPLLSESENTALVIEPPTDHEVDMAITRNMRNLMTVVKAVKKFKTLTASSRPPVMASILDESDAGHFSLPPGQYKQEKPALENRSQSLNTDNRVAVEAALVSEGVHRELSPTLDSHPNPVSYHIKRKPLPTYQPEPSSDEDDKALDSLRRSIDRTVEPNELPPFRSSVYNARTIDDFGRRGQAHDPLEDQLFLRIGPSTFAGHSTQEDSENTFGDDEFMVSESPGAADLDIYETAYRDEIERILARAQAAEDANEEPPQVYLTRRVDEKLLLLSGLAGKIAAHGDEAKSHIRDYTQFRERKARVADVSRALREAAKAEYEKRRQERKAWIEASKANRSEKSQATVGSNPGTPVESDQAATMNSPEAGSPRPLETSASWRAKAVDRGRHARTAFSGLVNTVKKSRRPEM